MLPLFIHNDGRSKSTTRLYAESENVRSTWTTKLEEAILLRQKSSQVFEMSIVVREESLTIGGSSNVYPPENRPTTRTMTCAAPFGRHTVSVAFPVLDYFAYHASNTRWAYPAGHRVCGGFVDREWEGPSMYGPAVILIYIQEMTRASSFPLGASPPRPTMRGGRGLRSHYHPFKRGASSSSRTSLSFTLP